MVEEHMQKVEVRPDEFNGLISNFAQNYIKEKVGGTKGDILAGLAGHVLGGGGGGERGNAPPARPPNPQPNNSYGGGGGAPYGQPNNYGQGGGAGGYSQGGGGYNQGGGGYSQGGGYAPYSGPSQPYNQPYPPAAGGNAYGGSGGAAPTGSYGWNPAPFGSGGADSFENSYGGGGGGRAPITYPNNPYPAAPYGGGSSYGDGAPNPYPNYGGNGPDPYGSSNYAGSGVLPSPQDEPKKERKRDKVMGFLGGVLGKDTEKDNKGYNHPEPQKSNSSGGFNLNDLGGIINSMSGGSGGDHSNDGKRSTATKILGGIGSLIGGGAAGKYAGGGGNVNPNSLKGEIIGNLIGKAAHRFLGVEPATGKILGAVAGNVIMGLGGKDNSLGNIGKVILDNIISGKFHRRVDPFVRPMPPKGGAEPSPIHPQPTVAPVDFYRERDRCLREKRLFEDPQFPATDASLFFTKKPPKRVGWLRPGQIVREPMLFTEGHSRFDVVQGELGDCWLLAAAANLTLKDELFYRVVPPDQSFTENYAGIFHFQFWQYGKWVDVVIDDRLPTSNGELLYMHSKSNNEFWSALLEKAYAKLHGSYEALKGGTTSEALEDMTGGLTEFFDLKNQPANLMSMMMRGFEMGSLFACSLEADPYKWEAKMRNGLVRGHAYSITGMRMVNGPRGQVCLLRIRNPWGNEHEWNGPWSDGSSEWRNIPNQTKQEMGLVFDHDGEFWMSFEDFVRNFEKMEICNLGPDVMNEIYQMTGVKPRGQNWATVTHEGAWIRNQTAGGCRNYINTFANNPQYRIKLTDSDPYDDDHLCTIIVAVLQKYRRNMKHMGLDNVPIGFAAYDAEGTFGRLQKNFFQANKSTMRSSAFINLREMTGRFRVPPGEYVIIPSTFEPNEEAEFMMRVYTNGFIESRQL